MQMTSKRKKCPLNKKYFRLNKQLSIHDFIEMYSDKLNDKTSAEHVLIKFGKKVSLYSTRDIFSYLYSKSKHRVGNIFKRFKLKVL